MLEVSSLTKYLGALSTLIDFDLDDYLMVLSIPLTAG